MASAVSIAHSFDPLRRPVRPPADETWLAPPTLDHAVAGVRIRELVLAHFAHRDDRDELASRLSPSLVYVPFWRVKLAVPAVHLAPSARNIAIANIEFPMPIPSYGGRAGVLMICARSAVPYTPRLPRLLGGTDALEVQKSELLPMTDERALSMLSGEEIVEADVDRARGEQTAKDTLVTLLASPGAARSVFLPRVESTVFVRYPLYYAPFGASDDDEHFVLLSARDGHVVSACYPRPPTISERVKRFLSG
jgi:hypothetical protein